jgi:hypothetical protein
MELGRGAVLGNVLVEAEARRDADDRPARRLGAAGRRQRQTRAGPNDRHAAFIGDGPAQLISPGQVLQDEFARGPRMAPIFRAIPGKGVSCWPCGIVPLWLSSGMTASGWRRWETHVQTYRSFGPPWWPGP